MERILCETCGSNDFFEKDGFAFCAYCRSKYDITELKKHQIGGESAEISPFTSVQLLQEKAEKLWKRGDADKARKLYAQILEIDPLNDIARKRSK